MHAGSWKSTREAFESHEAKPIRADVVQLVSARSSELEVPGSILSDYNVC